jgi:hypothetical protein
MPLVEVMDMIEINVFIWVCKMHYREIWFNIGRSTLERNFDVKILRAVCEACSGTWNLSTNSASALGPRKITENLGRVGVSRDLPDANWYLVSSPAINTRNLTCCCFLWNNNSLHICFYLHNLDEHQTFVYNICEASTCLDAHTCTYILYDYLSICEIWISVVRGWSIF